MTVPRDRIEQEITWFNQEVEKFKNSLLSWLQELGHTVVTSEAETTISEELSGPYITKQYNLQIDQDLKICIKPFGIWLIGAKGRIDISGPSGSEKFIFFSASRSGMTTEIKDSNGNVIERRSHNFFQNIDEENWYWYDDSSYRKVSKFSKEIVESLLERLQ